MHKEKKKLKRSGKRAKTPIFRRRRNVRIFIIACSAVAILRGSRGYRGDSYLSHKSHNLSVTLALGCTNIER